MRMIHAGVAAAAIAAFGTPVSAADLAVQPRDRGVTYQREAHSYERVTRHVAPRVVRRVVTTPVVHETVVIRRPLVVEEYPVYAAPVYAAPIYAYGGPVWRGRVWSPRRHFIGGHFAGHRFNGGHRRFAGRW
jgi:hypothetical protein